MVGTALGKVGLDDVSLVRLYGVVGTALGKVGLDDVSLVRLLGW